MSLIKNLKIARDPEGYWRSHGWGPEWRFPVTGPRGEPLAVSARMPGEWKATDVLKMAPEAAASSGSVAQAMALLAREVDAAGVIGVLGIGRAVKREGKPDAHLFAVIAFALADVAGPPPESIPGAEVEPVEFEHPNGPYRGIRVRRTKQVGAASDQLGKSVLTVQYLLRTDYGVLATTFATPQQDAFEKLTPVLDKIAGACWLDPAGR